MVPCWWAVPLAPRGVSTPPAGADVAMGHGAMWTVRSGRAPVRNLRKR